MDVARQKVPKQWVKELMLQLVLGTARRRFERMPQLWSEALWCHTCQTVYMPNRLAQGRASQARHLGAVPGLGHRAGRYERKQKRESSPIVPD